MSPKEGGRLGSSFSTRAMARPDSVKRGTGLLSNWPPRTTSQIDGSRAGAEGRGTVQRARCAEAGGGGRGGGRSSDVGGRGAPRRRALPVGVQGGRERPRGGGCIERRLRQAREGLAGQTRQTEAPPPGVT